MFLKILFTNIFILLFFTVIIYGQDVLQLVPYNGDPSTFIMTQIKADTTTNHGIPANRVYELQRDGIYLNTETFNVPAGSTMRLRANNGSGNKPIIFQFPTGTGANPQNPPGNLFVLLGGNLEMKNIAVSGYFEPIDTNFNNVQGGLVNTTQPGASMVIDSCLFTNINGQHLRTGSAAHVVKVTNTVFANMGALSRSNLGAGKGLDLREVSVDSLIIINNTFVNYQDRAIRHYNFSNPAAGTGNLGYCIIDHNSFVNGFGFHGLLSLGNVGSKVIITNNLFQDGFAGGEDSSDATRTAEWANVGEYYPNGRNRMSWVFTAPNDTTQWTVSNNFYSISDSGTAYLNAFGLTENTPLTWHINRRLGADSATAFVRNDISLQNIPRLMTNLMRWYQWPGGGNKTKNTPSSLWHKETDDMDRRGYLYYLDTLDASYSTAAPEYNGGTQGYPVGDLNWFPDKHQQWLNGESNLPAITLSATSIDFGTVAMGSSKTDSVQISNTGNAELVISSISSSNSNFTFSPSALNIAASGNAYLKITFTPSDTNAQNGSIDLTHNASGSPSSISVNGKGKTAVGISDPNNLPKEFALKQNYPNPFNPSTKISFSLKNAGLTTLAVYNVLGQKVAILVSGNLEAGSHDVIFDASNLSAGVYIYRLESGTNIAIKKMMLLK